MQTIGIFLGALALVAGIALGVYWLFWLLWCWVLPMVWVGGPSNLIAPNFWLFVGVCVLLSFIGRTIFGSRSKES